MRHSLAFVSYKDRKAVAAALKEIYRAEDADAGEAALDAFAEGPWGRKYPAIAQAWRRHWGEVIPFFAFPAEVRRIIYTTNAIEALNCQAAPGGPGPRPLPDRRGRAEAAVPGLEPGREGVEDAAPRVGMARAQFAILFDERFTNALAGMRFNRPPVHGIPDSPCW